MGIEKGETSVRTGALGNLVRSSVNSYRFLIILNANFIPSCSWVLRGISSAVGAFDLGLPTLRLR